MSTEKGEVTAGVSKRAENVELSRDGVDVRAEKVVTSGVFELDGGSWDVDNNVWIVGNDHEVIVFDPAHEAQPILEAIGDRKVLAIVATHAHNDHITAAAEVREASGAPVYLHPEDRVLWDMTYDWAPDADLADGDVLRVAGAEIQVIHTPGHAPGACCFYLADLDAVFSGDTLFNGGPGATGRSYSDRPTLVANIRSKLFALPPSTTVLTGHGDSTTLEAEQSNVTDEE